MRFFFWPCTISPSLFRSPRSVRIVVGKIRRVNKSDWEAVNWNEDSRYSSEGHGLGLAESELSNNNQRAVTAIHEAGHCLAHLHLGMGFDSVELAGDSGTLVNPLSGTQVKAFGLVYVVILGD